MNEPPLGRLERVDLRKAWEAEDRDFTPWLARRENLDVLAETLSLELETEAQEKNVGLFRADILCKEVGSGSDARVLIENQLERTDHAHLGQLMTYAAGLKAAIIIWIAKSFTDEHRAALDWLNGITDEQFHFFGLEVELWRIGGSPPAPKFNIVSKPNDWSRSIARAAAGVGLSETGIRQREYWGALLKVLDDEKGPVSGTPRMKKRSGYFMIWTHLRPHFRLATVIDRQHNQIGAELYVNHSNSEEYLERLKEKENEINREFNYPLEWTSKKISCLKEVNLEDESDWPRQHEWLAGRLNDLHRVFYDRVRGLNIDDRPSDD